MKHTHLMPKPLFYIDLSTLMIVAKESFRTYVCFYQTTWQHNPEDSTLQSHGQMNFKPHRICSHYTHNKPHGSKIAAFN